LMQMERRSLGNPRVSAVLAKALRGSKLDDPVNDLDFDTFDIRLCFVVPSIRNFSIIL